jgi:hypothetical protein
MFNFGDWIIIDGDPDKTGMVLMLTGSTVTVAFEKPSEFDTDRFGYYTEVYDLHRVAIA